MTDQQAFVGRHATPAEVLKSAHEILKTRSKAYGSFIPVVKGYAKTAESLGIKNLSTDQQFLVWMIVMKLQRWTNAPGQIQNADSLMDAINYLAALHVLSYPVDEQEKPKVDPEVRNQEDPDPYAGFPRVRLRPTFVVMDGDRVEGFYPEKSRAEAAVAIKKQAIARDLNRPVEDAQKVSMHEATDVVLRTKIGDRVASTHRKYTDAVDAATKLTERLKENADQPENCLHQSPDK